MCHCIKESRQNGSGRALRTIFPILAILWPRRACVWTIQRLTSFTRTLAEDKRLSLIAVIADLRSAFVFQRLPLSLALSFSLDTVVPCCVSKQGRKLVAGRLNRGSSGAAIGNSCSSLSRTGLINSEVTRVLATPFRDGTYRDGIYGTSINTEKRDRCVQVQIVTKRWKIQNNFLGTRSFVFGQKIDQGCMHREVVRGSCGPIDFFEKQSFAQRQR